MGILSGYKKFKKYLRTADGYRLCSEWTNADSVEMADGNTLQESVSALNNEVSSLNEDISALNSNLADSLGGLTFGVDSDGNPGYIKAGADTVTPFKDIVSIMSDVKFTVQSAQKTIWNSKGTGVVQASYKVPDDGVLKAICNATYYRSANMGESHSNKGWHVLAINDQIVLNSSNGDAFVNMNNFTTIPTFNVAKDDIVTYNYYLQWTGGDAIYAYITVNLATLFFQK